MADKFDAFGLEINLTSKGFDSIVNYFKQIESEGHKCEQTTDEINKSFVKLSDTLEKLGVSSDKIKKAFKQFSEEQRKSNSSIAKMQQLFKDGATVFGAFYASFAPMQKMYRFVDGIAAINAQLRMLHYSSGLGINSLQEFGAAAAMYGGSAQTLASGKQKYSQTIAGVRRGQPLGYLAESLKYGFGFDLNEQYEDRLERAIRHARTIKDEHDRIAFANTVDPANAKYILSGASHTEEEWQKYNDYFNKTAKGWQNGEGQNRATALTGIVEEYNQEMAKLSRSWQGIKDQIATALLPVITAVLKCIRSITDALNKHPKLISAITYLVAGLVTLFSALSFVNAVKSAIEFISKLKTITQLLKMIKVLSSPVGWLWNVLGIGGKSLAAGARNAAGATYQFIARGALVAKLSSIGTWISKMVSLIGTGIAAVPLALVVSALFAVFSPFIGFGLFKKFLKPWLDKEDAKNEKARNSGTHKDGSTNFYRNTIAQQYGNLAKWLESDDAKKAPLQRIEAAKKRLKTYEAQLKKWKIPLENARWAVENMEENSDSVNIRNAKNQYDNSKRITDNSRRQQINYFQSEGGKKDAETAGIASRGMYGDSAVVVSTSERS